MPQYYLIPFCEFFHWLRYRLLLLIAYNPLARKYIQSCCAADFFFWAEFFVYLPHYTAETKTAKPFLPYRFQYDFIKKLIKYIEKGDNLAVEKAMKMGSTTCVALVVLWYWLYRPHSNFAWLARVKKDIYYTKNPGSVFSIFKFVLEHLHDNVRPDYRIRHNRRRIYFSVITNLSNGNKIYGFSGSRLNFLPGRHFKAVIFDDMAFQPFADFHHSLFGPTTGSMLFVSTPNGTSNLFFYLVHVKKVDCYKLYWQLHPDYTDDWYKTQCQSLDPEYIEQFVNTVYFIKWRKQRSAAIKKPETTLPEASLKQNELTASTKNIARKLSKKDLQRSWPFKYNPGDRNRFKIKHKGYHETYKPAHRNPKSSTKMLLTSFRKLLNFPRCELTPGDNRLLFKCWQYYDVVILKKTRRQLKSGLTALNALKNFAKEDYRLSMYSKDGLQCLIKSDDSLTDNKLDPFRVSEDRAKAFITESNQPDPQPNTEDFYRLFPGTLLTGPHSLLNWKHYEFSLLLDRVKEKYRQEEEEEAKKLAEQSVKEKEEQQEEKLSPEKATNPVSEGQKPTKSTQGITIKFTGLDAARKRREAEEQRRQEKQQRQREERIRRREEAKQKYADQRRRALEAERKRKEERDKRKGTDGSNVEKPP